MLYNAIRILLFLILFIITYLIIKFKKPNYSKKQKTRIYLALFICLLISQYLPLENAIITYSSPEAAYNYAYYQKPIKIVKNSEFAVAVYDDNDYISYTKIDKVEGGWKLNKESFVGNIDAGLYSVGEYTSVVIKGTNSAFIFVTDPFIDYRGKTINKIGDSTGSNFDSTSFTLKSGKATMYYTFTKLPLNNYYLYINDQEKNIK